MSKYILTCPNCGENSNLTNHGNTFHCKDCDAETELEDMDFDYEE